MSQPGNDIHERTVSKTISHSSYRASSSSTNDLEAADLKQLESFVFPFNLEMARIVNIPQVLFLVIYVIDFIQMLSTTLWLGSSTLWGETLPTALLVLRDLCDLGVMRDSLSDTTIPYIFVIAYSMIMGIFMEFCEFDFKSKHRFVKWRLFTYKICEYLIVQVFVPIDSSLINKGCVELYKNQSSTSIFIILVMLLIDSVTMSSFHNTASFQASTAVLCRSFTAAWNPTFLYNQMIFIFSLSAIVPDLDLFAFWLTPCFIALSILVVIYFLRQLYFLPFHYHYMNVISGGCFSVYLSNLVYAFVKCFVSIPSMVVLYVDIIALVIGLTICGILMGRRKNRIVKALSISSIGEVGQVTESMKRAYFDTLQFSSTDDAISFLHVGVANHCDLLIDFSFMRYLVENYAVDKIVIAVANMASFFPSELQFFSYCLSLISKFKNLEVYDQYILYQMKRVHILRQSSVSSEATNVVSKISKESREAIGAIRGFWKEIGNAKTDISFASLRSLNFYISSVNESFLDATDKYPNNQAICEEYSNFLLEAMGDFSGAAQMKKKASLIEQGKLISLDHSFRSLVNVYPQYLLSHILDSRGSFIGKNASLGNASSSSSVMSETNVSNGSEMDTKGEQIVSTICDHGKLRLAIQSALSKLKIYPFDEARIICFIVFFLSLIFYGLFYILSPLIAESTETNVAQSYYMSILYDTIQRIGYIASIQDSILSSKFTGRTYVESVLGDNLTTESSLYEPYLLMYQDSLEVITIINELLGSLMGDPNSTINVVNSLTVNNISYCSFNGTISKALLNASIKTASVDISDDSKIVSSMGDESNVSRLPYLHSIATNSLAITEQGYYAELSLRTIGSSQISSIISITYLTEILPPLVLFVIFVYFGTINIISLFKEMARISDFLRKIKKDVIEESLKPISLKKQGTKIQTNNAISVHQTNRVNSLYAIMIALQILVPTVYFFINAFITVNTLNNMSNIFTWFGQDDMRSIQILRAVTTLGEYVSGAVSKNWAKAKFTNQISTIITAHENLLVGMIGFDSSLDTFQFSDICSSNVSLDYNSYLHCISLDRQIIMAESFLSNLLESFDSLNTSLDTREYASLIYLIDESLFSALTSFHAKFYDAAISVLQNLHSSSGSWPYWVSGICVSLLFCLISLILIHNMSIGFETAKMLISFLPPMHVVKNRPLMQLILGKHSEETDVSMSLSESIVYHSSSAAIIMNSDEVIEMVNPSLQSITGFSPDQVLGQKISWLIPQSVGSSSSSDEGLSSAQFYQRLAQMKNGIGERIAVVNVRCQSDFSSPVSVRATILAVFDEKTDIFESFVLLLKDMSIEMKQKREVQEAKKRTDKLLESLVPSKVLQVIKQNTGSAFFISEVATVIFIEINGLIDCVHSMAPKQLISTLNSIYDKFDEHTSKYPAVHSLKTNDELYVGCCGLFDFKDNQRAQAEQAVRFCLDLLSGMEELNDELGLELKLRIGINMGGPLVGSVLNLQIPSFDILGDVISLAVRMQSGGAIGVVQIGESVVRALPAGQYTIAAGQSFNTSHGGIDRSFVVQAYTPQCSESA